MLSRIAPTTDRLKSQTSAETGRMWARSRSTVVGLSSSFHGWPNNGIRSDVRALQCSTATVKLIVKPADGVPDQKILPGDVTATGKN